MRFRHVQLLMDCRLKHQWYNILLSSTWVSSTKGPTGCSYSNAIAFCEGLLDATFEKRDRLHHHVLQIRKMAQRIHHGNGKRLRQSSPN